MGPILCFQVAFVKESGALVLEHAAGTSALMLPTVFLRNELLVSSFSIEKVGRYLTRGH